MSNCCKNCFTDRHIRELIDKSTQVVGKCDFCFSENVGLYQLEELTIKFQIIFDLYDENPVDGLEISKLFQDDWLIFKDAEIARAIVNDILQDIQGKKYLPKNRRIHADIWEKYREEIKHNNRFFPKSEVDIKNLSEWMKRLSTQSYPLTLYRARKSENNTMFDKESMKKPPKKLASGGRANPVGISYLYMASNPETALSEIRPHKGEFVSIAEINLEQELYFADLRNPISTLSPFDYDDISEDLIDLHRNMTLLQTLSEELSKPISPQETHLEYLPSQYLAELIKNAEFDGIIYKSSVGSGDNYALFNDSKIEIVDIKLHKVTDLSFSSSLVNS